VQFSG
jgi:cas1_HMARI: CRISPR-associated endonuclease Cas1, HMARI/TNEAP subtype